MLYRLLSQPLKALTLLVSSLCTSIVAADELDYIWFSPDVAQNINILFVLDASSSLVESYKLKFSLVDPYLNPYDPNAAALLATKNAIESKLVNTAVVPMTLTESHDSWHCPVDVELYAEGYYADCPVPYMERWFLQRIDVARTVISDVLPALVGTNVGFMRTGLNNKSFWRWYADGGPTGINIRTAYPDAGQTNNGAYVIQAMKPIETNEDASEIALRLDQTYVENILDANQTPLTESLFEAFYYLTGQQTKSTNYIKASIYLINLSVWSCMFLALLSDIFNLTLQMHYSGVIGIQLISMLTNNIGYISEGWSYRFAISRESHPK